MPRTALSPEHGGNAAVLHDSIFERGQDEGEKTVVLMGATEGEGGVEQFIKATESAGLRIVVFAQMHLTRGQA